MPDFPPGKRPDYRPQDDAEGMDAIPGDAPFMMMPDGRGALFSPSGPLDAPIPTHYEPLESPVPNELYPSLGANPLGITWVRPENPLDRGARRSLSARRLDVPADRAPHGRADEP